MVQPKAFNFLNYNFDELNQVAVFRYSFDDEIEFEERVEFPEVIAGYDKAALDEALFLAFILVGTSYYKCFPKVESIVLERELDDFQANFFTKVYQEGLSQFAFENQLTRDDLIQFQSSYSAEGEYQPLPSSTSEPILALQSGGKDSVLATTLLKKQTKKMKYLYIGSGESYPALLNIFGSPQILRRSLDVENLKKAQEMGGLNGHVPITYIISAYSLIHSILTGCKTIVLSIAHEGEEPHALINDLEVNHQWSKTWEAEQALQEYVWRYGVGEIAIGSILRHFSELAVAEMFVKYCWDDFGHKFSSCNVINYRQKHDNTHLKWCGECPKCANNFLLFAPFVEPSELASLFNGQNLFAKPQLLEIWKGLLGIDGVMKPFECVGEIAELRLAFHMAVNKWGGQTYNLPFEVPKSEFDYLKQYDSQPWAKELFSKVL